jgi:hypothetical protein
MKLVRIIVGELLLWGASILIFRSVWTLLDQYLGIDNLWVMLIIGVVVPIVGLAIIIHEVECEIKKRKIADFSSAVISFFCTDLF